ncbi:MAG: methylmalonyl Co-A mutase-associated GTPase MeaB [Myxococcales bacterium]|nr:MAG: methylmalonyl Co-A mutase-associated GTPase MeaB [Myxococcales bacterium]
MSLAPKVLAGDLRAAARLMRLCDDDFASVVEVMKAIYPHTGKSAIVGVTGNPGSGKSSLVDRMVQRYRAHSKKVGVVAIDPTSPFSGGAIMGDRVRMNRHFGDEGVFIRSLATRGHLGGLSKSTAEVTRVMEAWGADPVIVETVGVGQDEVDIVKMAQTSIVVMVPGLGDEIQAIKAGLMEIADIFVVNKADLAGADRAVADIQYMLEMVPPAEPDAWKPRILRTVAFRDEGVDEVVRAVDEHRDWLGRTGRMEAKQRERSEVQFFDLALSRLADRLRATLAKDEFAGWSERLSQRKQDPYTLLEQIADRLFKTP